MVRALITTLALLTTASAAPPSPGSDPAAESEAKTLFAEGNRLLAAGDAGGALGMYRSAYERFPNPKLLLNIGTALRQLGRNAEAAEAYEQYLRESGFDSKKAAEVAQILGELEPLVARLRIETSPPGAVVTLGEKNLGAFPEPKAVRVEPGSHTVSATMEGHEPNNVSVTIAAGEEQPVRIALKALPPPPEPEPVVPPAELRPGQLEVEAGFEPDDLGHAGRVGLTARSETDLRTAGTGTAFGATLGVGRYVEISALALIQRETGMRLAGSVWLLPSAAVKPFLRLGVPMFFVDGAKVGFHAGAGLVWDLASRYGIGIDAAVEHFPGAPTGVYKTAAVLGAGLVVRIN